MSRSSSISQSTTITAKSSLLSTIASFGPLLLSLSMLLSSSAALDVPDCPSKDFLQSGNFSGFDPLEQIPNCFCDPFGDDPKAVHVDCILVATLPNLTYAINQVKSVGGDVRSVKVSSFRFPDGGFPANYFLNLGLQLQALRITVCDRGYTVMNESALAGQADSLLEIHVTDCLMQYVPVAFRNLNQLKLLNLTTSGLDGINSKSFEGLPELTILDLSENRMEFIEEGCFDNLPSLKVLSLGPHNRFNETVLYEINKIPSLIRLTMPSVNLKEWPPNALSNLSSLDSLDLTHNDIKVLSNQSFTGLTNLTFLDIRINYISQIDDGAFEPLENLEVLHMGGNYIKTLSNGTFRGLRQLKQLRLDYEEFQYVPNNTFADMPNLISLDLSRNYKWILMDTDTFAGLDNLILLNASHAGLEKLPLGVLRPLPALEILDFYNSSLTYLDRDDFAYSRNLTHLFLTHTYLEALPNGIIRNLDSLQLIDISKNSWICDDRMAAFLREISVRYNVAAEAGRMFVMDNSHLSICIKPPELLNQRLLDLDPSTLKFYDASKYTTKPPPITTTTTLPVTSTASTMAKLLEFRPTQQSIPSSGGDSSVASSVGVAGQDTKQKTTTIRTTVAPRRGWANTEVHEDGAKAVERSKLGIAIAVVVAAALTILVVVVVILLMRRKRAAAAMASEDGGSGDGAGGERRVRGDTDGSESNEMKAVNSLSTTNYHHSAATANGHSGASNNNIGNNNKMDTTRQAMAAKDLKESPNGKLAPADGGDIVRAPNNEYVQAPSRY